VHQLAYRRFVTALEQACRVIRFDERGTGLSDPTDALPSMDQPVVDLAAVMDAAGSQAAAVFGISWLVAMVPRRNGRSARCCCRPESDWSASLSCRWPGVGGVAVARRAARARGPR
jgi:hypothetical protein